MKLHRFGARLLAVIAGSLLLADSICAQAQWYKLFDRPYSSSSTSSFRDDSVPAIAEFKDQLYMGTGTGYRTGNSTAHIYRLVEEDCRIWEDVSPPWQPAYVPYNVDPFWWSSITGGSSMAMERFKKRLYLGTDQGEVLRTKNGISWENVSGKWFAKWQAPDQVSALAKFKGYLYVAFAGVEIWRTDGLSWQPVVGPFPAVHGNGFGESGKLDLRSLAVFNGYLYAGVGKDAWNGIKLWRTKDGVNWTKYKELFKDPMHYFLPGHVHAMKGFKGLLHVGEAEGVGLFRTDGSVKPDGTAKIWNYQAKVASGTGIYRFEEQAGTLFLGTYNLLFRPCANCTLVYRSTNGKQWSAVPGSPVNSSVHQSVSAMLSSSGSQSAAGQKLYVGTSSVHDSGRVVMYQYGPSPGTCFARAVMNAVQDLSGSIGKVRRLLRKCAVLPCLWSVPPLIRPIPPVGDVIPDDAFEAPLVREIIEAAELRLQVAPGDEALQDRVVEDLRNVSSTLIQALQPFHNGFGGDEVLDRGINRAINQEINWSTVDDAIAGLKEARRLCRDVAVVLSWMRNTTDDDVEDDDDHDEDDDGDDDDDDRDDDEDDEDDD